MRLDRVIEDICGQYDKGSQPGLGVGVLQNGRVLYCRGFGKANLEYNIPIDDFTVFHCCSMAKQFTATGIALLEEEGKINTDQPVNEILPLSGAIWQKIAVKHLIHMTNGLFDAYGTANLICGIREDDYFTKGEFWHFINASDWLMFEPGTRWDYGNTGYFLLAEIIEKVSGLRMAEFADRFIFKPLGMTRSFFRDDKSKIIPNRAVGYSNYDHIHYQGDNPYCTQGDQLCINNELMDVPGAGQLWSCLHDLFLWEMNFYHNKLGRTKQDLIDKLTARGRLNDGTTTKYAYGQFVFNKKGHEHVAHGGWAGGYSCFIDRILSQGISVIVLANHTDIFEKIEVYDGSNGIIDQIMNVVVPSDCPENQVTAVVSRPQSKGKADIGLFIGMYQNPENSIIWEVGLEDDQLFIKENFGNKINLEQIDDRTFQTQTHGMIRFQSDQAGFYTIIQTSETNRLAFFQAYLPHDLNNEELAEYAGTYENKQLREAYRVSVQGHKLFFQNINRHHTAMDLPFEPTIHDCFLTRNDYISYYCVTFSRDLHGQVNRFSFRDDEMTMREKFVFVK